MQRISSLASSISPVLLFFLLPPFGTGLWASAGTAQAARAAEERAAIGFDSEPVEAPHPPLEQDAAAGEDRIDFHKSVLPLLQKHCLSCHGPEMQSGSLRLDSRQHAAMGGDSKLPILIADPEMSELYRRIATEDSAARMPKFAPPLAPSEIAIIRAWLEQGAVWPNPQSAMKAGEGGFRSLFVTWWSKRLDAAEELQKNVPYAWAWLLIVLAGLVLVLLVERGKRAWRAGEPWRKEHPSWWVEFCEHVPRRRYFQWLLVSVCVAVTGGLAGHASLLRQRVASLERQNARQQSKLGGRTWHNAFDELFGSPPVPERPHHPRRLSGTYYRGNCERNEKLFNNGNYLTARFHLDLCDAAGRRLEPGDEIPPSGVFVRFELERAPNTTDTLFSPQIIDSIFLSESVLDPRAESDVQTHDRPVAVLETLQPDWRWRAQLAVLEAGAAAPETLSGVIYVYKGDPFTAPPNGQWHYGIRYDLEIVGGKLTAKSDLWMGVLLFSGNLAFTDPAQIPLCEWFDWRPLPEIQGPNSTDPLLLGIPEHVPTPGAAASPSPPDETEKSQ